MINVDIEKELEEFKRTFERDELWSFKFWIKKFVTIYKFSFIFNDL